MTLSVHHIALNAHDGAAFEAIFTAGGGFAPVPTTGAARWLAAPNAFVAIHPTAEPIGEPQAARRVCDPGITHFCVQSAQGELLWRRLDAAGLAFNDAPVALGTGAIYAYGRDPEHIVIEVEGVGDAPADAAPWIAHVALATADLDRLADFYTRLIGRRVHHGGTFKNKLFENITGLKDVEVSARWIMADNMIFEMWRYLNPPTVAVAPAGEDEPGYRHVGFAAVDLAAERARLETEGIHLWETTAAGLPALAGADPDGNRFVIVKAPPSGHPLSLAGLADPDIVTARNRHLLEVLS